MQIFHSLIINRATSMKAAVPSNFFCWNQHQLPSPFETCLRCCVAFSKGLQGKLIGHFGKYHNTLFCPPKYYISFVSRFSWDLQMVPREYTNNAYTKSWGTTKSIMFFFPKWPIGSLQCPEQPSTNSRTDPRDICFVLALKKD